MNDFSTPRRMSTAAYVIIWIQTFKQMMTVFAFLVAMMLIDSDKPFTTRLEMTGLFLGFIVIVVSILAFLQYYFRKFHVENGKLIYSRGLISRNTTSIPLSRIHNLRTKSGIFYRMVDMRGVAFDTLASDKQEVELILDESEWQALLRQVRLGEDFSGATDTAVTPPPPFEQETLHVSNINIIKGALCQNHLKGFVILGTVAVYVFDKVSELNEDLYVQLVDYIDSHAGYLSLTIGQILLVAVVIYMVVMLLWTGSIALRYYGMTIDIADNRLTFESGLFSRYTSRIARDKATVLTIKQNPLEKLANCQTIAIHQAKNVTDEKKRGNITIYGSDLGNRILDWWIGNEDENENVLPFTNRDPDKDSNQVTAHSGKGVFFRQFIPHLLIAVIAMLVCIFAVDITMPAIILGSLYVVLMAVRAVMAWRYSSIELTDRYVLVNGGSIARIREYVKCRDIESLRIRRTPFTRFTGRVSLQIATNSGTINVYSLKFADAYILRFNLIK